jgi:hypothetical protein
MSLLREAAWHTGARVLSAVASTSVFALLARQHDGAAGQRLLFLVFVSGFAVAFLRSFGAYVAGLRGGQSRRERLLRSRTMLSLYGRASPGLLLLSLATLLSQGLAWPAALVGSLILVAAGLDSDLLLASVGRPPKFSLGFAAGSAITLLWLLVVPASQMRGLVAVALPWCAVASVQSAVTWRFLVSRQARRPVLKETGRGVHWRKISPPLLLALYDGLILNMPFLSGVQMPSAVGLDLAIATRLFASTQPFFPLVNHWSAMGRLQTLGQQFKVGEGWVFWALLVGSGLAASVAFIVVFGVIRGQPLEFRQYGLFVLLLVGYCTFAVGIRLVDPRLRWGVRAGVAAVALLFFAAGTAVQAALHWPSAWYIAAWQALALGGMGLWLLARSAPRAAERPAPDQEE